MQVQLAEEGGLERDLQELISLNGGSAMPQEYEYEFAETDEEDED